MSDDGAPRFPIDMSRGAFRVMVAVSQGLKLAGFLGMIAFVATGRATAVDAALFVAFYAITMFGIAVGFHRLFSHRCCTVTPGLRWAIAGAGAMAAQGTPLLWAAYHRMHHRFSDAEGDPHSPYVPQTGWRGLWHAHTGWILDYYPPADWERYVPDLLDDPVLASVHRHAIAWIWLGALVPAAIGGLASASWLGALAGLCFGGWGRMFVVEQVVSLVNSYGHRWGRRAFQTSDHSTNNTWLAVLTFGDGWHNNHHAFPASARVGLGRWQWDAGYALLRLGAACKQVSGLIVPDPAQVERRRAEGLALAVPAAEAASSPAAEAASSLAAVPAQPPAAEVVHPQESL